MLRAFAMRSSLDIVAQVSLYEALLRKLWSSSGWAAVSTVLYKRLPPSCTKSTMVLCRGEVETHMRAP